MKKSLARANRSSGLKKPAATALIKITLFDLIQSSRHRKRRRVDSPLPIFTTDFYEPVYQEINGARPRDMS